MQSRTHLLLATSTSVSRCLTLHLHLLFVDFCFHLMATSTGFSRLQLGWVVDEVWRYVRGRWVYPQRSASMTLLAVKQMQKDEKFRTISTIESSFLQSSVHCTI
ncbi:hypothetical protein VPH35_007108 [Triticum aestivum]